MKLINPTQELQHILDYVSKTWEGVNTESITQLWNDAIEQTKHGLDPYAINTISESVRNLKENYADKDISIHFLNHSIPLHSFSTHTIFAYDYLCSFEKINRQWTSEDFLDYLEPMTPNDWQPLYSEYYSGMDKYIIKNSLPPFLGTQFANEESFVEKIGIEHVMYYAKEQDTLPETSLAYAIVQQASLINKHNNKVTMFNEWINSLNSINDDNLQLSLSEPFNVAMQHFMITQNPSYETYHAFDLIPPRKSAKP